LLAELVKKSNDGDYRAPDRVTLGHYLEQRWLPAKKAQLRASTFDSYRRNIEIHVAPAIGAVPLQRLTPEHLDALYAELLTSGRRNGNGGGLSVKTVRNIHTMLHKALADAARKGTVPRNVAALADPPRLSSAPRPEMMVWDADQLRRFLEEIAGHRLYPAFYLLATTGMRRGEVLGLRWGDLDLDRHSISVSRALVIVAYKPQQAGCFGLAVEVAVEKAFHVMIMAQRGDGCRRHCVLGHPNTAAEKALAASACIPGSRC
jgi:integrase